VPAFAAADARFGGRASAQAWAQFADVDRVDVFRLGGDGLPRRRNIGSRVSEKPPNGPISVNHGQSRYVLVEALVAEAAVVAQPVGFLLG
jgi:hypothetical protein